MLDRDNFGFDTVYKIPNADYAGRRPGDPEEKLELCEVSPSGELAAMRDIRVIDMTTNDLYDPPVT